jgi:hypothetical protein
MSDDIQDALAEALAKLQAAREAILPLLDAGNGEMAPVAARLKRMAAEVARIEKVIADQEVVSDKP